MIDPADLATFGQIEAPEEGVGFSLMNSKTGSIPISRGSAQPRAHAPGSDRVQRKESRSRDAVLRAGVLLESEAQGPLTDPVYIKARADCVRL